MKAINSTRFLQMGKSPLILAALFGLIVIMLIVVDGYLSSKNLHLIESDKKIKTNSIQLINVQSDLHKLFLNYQQSQQINFDLMNAKQGRIINLFNEIAKLDETGELRDELSLLRDQLMQQIGLINQFKPLTSTIKNSSNYLPTSIEECRQNYQGSTEFALHAKDLLSLSEIASSNAEKLDLFKKAYIDFEKNYPSCKATLAHSKLLTQNLDKQFGLLSAIAEQSIEPRIINLSEKFNQLTQELSQQNQTYQNLLLITTLISFITLVLTLFKLARNNQSLALLAREREEHKNIFQAISEVTQTITELNTDKEIYQKLTEIIHQYMHIPSCWVGQKDIASNIVVTAASGLGRSIITRQNHEDDNETIFKAKPIRDVFLTQKPLIIHNILENEKSSVWYQSAQQWEVDSLAVFPIMQQNKTSAILVLYSQQADFFSNKNVDLIQELIEDIENRLYALSLEKLEQHHQEELAIAAIAFNSQEAILITDNQNQIIRVNPAFEEITGYQMNEVIGKSPNILKSNRQDNAFYESMWTDLTNQGKWQGELWNRRKDGSMYLCYQTITAYRDKRNKIINYISHAIDLTKSKEAEQQLSYIQTHDLLTELPNKAKLVIDLNEAITTKSSQILLLLNIRNFKIYNETLGHEVADSLLQMVAKRLVKLQATSTTEFELKASLVCRLGSDEFALLVPIEHVAYSLIEKAIEALAKNIRLQFANPFNLSGEKIAVEFNMGATITQMAEKSMNAIQQAATATIHAKLDNQTHLAIYNQAMSSKAIQQRQLEQEISEAVRHDQFELFYQPQINCETQQIIGTEALIRWRKPSGEMVSPFFFIPILEESGQIIKVGQWILDQVIQDMKMLNEKTDLQLQTAINLSVVQFKNEHLADEILHTLKQQNYPTNLVAFEVTESMLIHSLEDVLTGLNKLKTAGIDIAIDDFGTGYSSLAYIKNLPISKLKIDKSFIDEIHQPKDLAIVKTIIELTRSLGLKSIAEGVEEQAQKDRLVQLGCDEIQGYYYSKPLPITDLIQMIQDAKA